MVKRKVDNRIRVLIENGMALGHRTMVVLVGDKSREQVVYLHHILSKTSLKQANVLWCYKKELTFSSHRKKRIKQLKAKNKMGQAEINEDDPFEMFVSMTDIRYCYYKETHKILGNTFKMCVLQDFEALTPNILCRTMETVEGGGVILLLLESMNSLRQLYTLSMDVHSRFRTDAHQHVVPRFNERFILSLGSCSSCIVMDDQLRILPLSSHLRDLQPVPPKDPSEPLSENDQALLDLKNSLKETPPIGILVSLCKTLDQAKVVLEFIMTITEKSLQTTATLTAGRGRGKSAALGISIASAIAFGYSNIFVTSPSPENLKTLFEFILKGLQAIGYEEHLHYQVLRSSDPQLAKSIVRVTINRDHNQVIQYINPTQHEVLGQAELVVIDEAAAIPLPHVQKLMGPYLVFLSSTVSGYEGTGRSLSLKLFDELRTLANADNVPVESKRQLKEMSLDESIRYKNGDQVEAWLHRLLCLEANLSDINNDEIPLPEECELYYVNKDTLFGYHKVTEKFLKQVMGLLVSSHYRNTPDDLQTLSDAPAHHLFVLIPPQNEKSAQLPTVLCVLQVSLEGKISKAAVSAAANQTDKPSGDLIPWTVSNLFQNEDFPQLSGARIVRIATRPGLQSKGYGSRAIKLLTKYYEKTCSHADAISSITAENANYNFVKEDEVGLLEESLSPKTDFAPLFVSLEERVPESLHYLGVSYGATHQLLSFWKKAGFTPVYISQVSNPLTGENTTIMLKVLGEAKTERSKSWLADFWFDFKKRITILLGMSFRHYDCKFGLSVLSSSIYKQEPKAPLLSELEMYITPNDLNRLRLYNNNQCDAALISDVIPNLARLYFLAKIPNMKLKPIPSAILCGVGIQRKDVSKVSEELGIDKSYVMKELHSFISSFIEAINNLFEEVNDTVTEDLDTVENVATKIKNSISTALNRQEEDKMKLQELIDMEQYQIKSNENENSIDKPRKKKLNINMNEISNKKKKK